MSESKLAKTNYKLTITQLGSPLVLSTTGSCLIEVVRLVRNLIPTMDDYSKVYREMRKNVGMYTGLFVFPDEEMKVRHFAVTIDPDLIFEADLKRLHKRFAKGPYPSDGIDKEAALKHTETAEKSLSKKKK